MSATIDILRGELERLFSLEEMTTMSQGLLGLDPQEVGGTGAKASFARALTERCLDGDRLDALVDVIRVQRREVDPRVFDVSELVAREELVAGRQLGDFTIQTKLGEGDLGVVYRAQREGNAYILKILRRDVTRDNRATQRFLTASRLAFGVGDRGLPEGGEAGQLDDGKVYVAYRDPNGESLSARFAQTGPAHVGELKPLLRSILDPLAALHKANLVHGNLKLENVILGTPKGDEEFHSVLVDFGADKLRQVRTGSNGHSSLIALFGSPKTTAPEVIRGKSADARTDVYAFGAILYELLSGKPVFPSENMTDAAFAHLTREPEAPSLRAPRGWVTKEVDQFVLQLLSKDVSRRPKDASALLEAIDSLGRQSTALRAAQAIPTEKVEGYISALLADVGDAEAQIALEKTIDEGADPVLVGDAFARAALRAPMGTAEDRETKKSLYYRAARIFDGAVRDKARAEKVYEEILDIDPNDEVARTSLEEAKKAQGKFEEIIEMLLERSQAVPPGEERALAMAEIGRIYLRDLDDSDQALVAFTQALSESPSSEEYAQIIEQLAASRLDRWQETLASLTDTVQNGELAGADRSELLARTARWYDGKLGRADLALMAYNEVLKSEPAHELAGEGLTVIYKRAQQWPELAQILVSRADAAGSTPRSRDLRTEAAELFEAKLNDPKRAWEIYAQVLAEDPGHAKASDALARIAERAGDFPTLVRVLEQRAEARRGSEKAEALVRVAEVFEDHLDDLAEATRRYEGALAVHPQNVGALKGLDRIFNRSGRYRELLEVLEKQIAAAATPRQKINLYERVAALHDEEFLDNAAAAAALEQILKMDPGHDGALTGLARHYRTMDRWEKVVAIYERHAQSTQDDGRKVELLMQRARCLAEQIGSPEGASKVYEEILKVNPHHAGALEALAQLRVSTGDAYAALSAIEALAAKATTPEGKAEQWMRAARLLEARGDVDSAIERYKMALEANPRDTVASSALRKAFGRRGDAGSVVSLVEKELGWAETDLQKARLYGELARIYRGHLGELGRAETAAKKALELDGTNPDGLIVIGDIAYDEGRMADAAKSYETVIGRATSLPKDDAVGLLVRFLEAFGKAERPNKESMPPQSMPPQSMSPFSLSQLPIGSSWDVNRDSTRLPSVPPSRASQLPAAPTNPKMLAAIELLKQIAPTDVDALARAANALFEFGDPDSAYQMHHDLLEKHGKSLTGSDRALALYHLGESARRSNRLQEAEAPLVEAIDVDPAAPKPVRALGRLYEELGRFEDAVSVRKRRLQFATGIERFELLLEMGDVEFTKLNDRTRAERSYVAALEERPDDRKLLGKLMQLYSEEKDWAKLVEVVVRLAEFVDDSRQRAKYMQTAATICAKQLNEIDQAIVFYERALVADPGLEKAALEVVGLYRQRNEHGKVEKLLNAQLDRAKQAGDRDKMVKALDLLGDLYERFLDDHDMAIDAFEAAAAFDAEDRTRTERLAELYSSDVVKYLDKAVQAQQQLLRKNPYRVQSYKALRHLYTEAKRADAAWCLCQALSVLNLAEPDEERFFLSHKAGNAAPAKAALDEADWQRLTHGDVDELLTRIFALIQPTILRVRTQPLEALGYDPRYAIDTSLHPYPVSQTLHYARGVLGLQGPLVFQNPNDPNSLGFLHAHRPSIVLGRAAFETNVQTQQVAFFAGRHLAYFRPGFYVRQLVPTGTGLKAWLFAAIKLSVPQFPIAQELGQQVQEAMGAMHQDFHGAMRDRLASLVTRLLQAGGALDLKRWVSGIDLSADRAGLLLAHDLQVTTEVIRATDEGSSVPVKERMKEIVLFSASENYFALREKLRITVNS